MTERLAQDERKTTKGIGLIVDSGCDFSPEIREETGAVLVPLKVCVDEDRLYLDDGSADIPSLLQEIRQSRNGAKSACPSVEDYAERMRAFDSCFVVTLSRNLSGSYNAALAAADMVREESPEKKIYVFDSKSASAGEVALLLFLREQIDAGLDFERIIPLAEAQIGRTRTLFVLQDLNSLIKSGRVAKIQGLIASALQLLPIMGDNGDGEIRLISKVRGLRRSQAQMVEIVKKLTSGARQNTLRLIVGYCNCAEQAAKLKEKLLEQCAAIQNVYLVPTGAVSSIYANEGGIVVAFAEY